MQEIQFIRGQLQTAISGFVWAVENIPTGRQFVIPLPVFGDLPAIRLAFRVGWYFEHVLYPVVFGWHNEDVNFSSVARLDDEAQMWQQLTPKSLFVVVQYVPDQVGRLLKAIDELDLTSLDLQLKHHTPWGNVSLTWVIVHAYQYLVENTNTMLNMALYWDMYLEAQKQARWEQGERNRDEGE